LQRRVERLGDEHDVLVSEHQRRADLEHVARPAGRAHQHAAAPHPVRHGVGQLGVRFLRLRIAHQVDAGQHADAADVTDRVVAPLDLAQRGPEGGADARGPRDQLFVLDHVEHRERRSARHRIAAEGREPLRRLGESLGELPARDQRRDGVAVAHRLAECHDVGGDTLRRERPQVLAAAPVPDLHLVGDVERAGVVRPLGQCADGVRGRHGDPVGGEPAVDERRGRLHPALAEPRHGRHELRRHVALGIAVPVGGVERLHVLGPAGREPFLR
jgi:hypothetical protein